MEAMAAGFFVPCGIKSADFVKKLKKRKDCAESNVFICYYVNVKYCNRTQDYLAFYAGFFVAAEKEMRMKKRIAGILLVVLSLSLLAFWELWGRETITYERVVVLKESQPQNTLITREMLRERRIEKAAEGAIHSEDAEKIIGLETTQFVAAGTELHQDYFQESKFAVGEKEGKYILSIPDQWLKSYPQTLRRGDRAFFYCGGEIVTDAIVAYVRDGANQEVYYSDEERLTSSAAVSLVEVVVTADQAAALGKLADKGNKFVVMYY